MPACSPRWGGRPRCSRTATCAGPPRSSRRSPTRWWAWAMHPGASGQSDSDRQEVDVDTSLDGNAAAGALDDLFTFDVTTAVSTCATCGDGRPVSELHAYMDAP